MAKNSPANIGDAGDAGFIPRSESCPREENGNLLKYSCLRKPMDSGAQWATVHGVHGAGHNLVSTGKIIGI